MNNLPQSFKTHLSNSPLYILEQESHLSKYQSLRLRRKEGLPVRGYSPAGEQYKRVKSMRDQGHTAKAIAEALGITPRHVYRVLQKADPQCT